jgi:PIN domain nuclease of toxin-antitoxin system
MQVAPQRLSAPVRELLQDPEHGLLLSAASSWEIALKWSLGKLPLPMSPAEYVLSRMERQDVRGLPVEHRHALHLAELPLLHRDPFDRLLIAQAQTEHLHVLTADPAFRAYDVDLLWAV